MVTQIPQFHCCRDKPDRSLGDSLLSVDSEAAAAKTVQRYLLSDRLGVQSSVTPGDNIFYTLHLHNIDIQASRVAMMNMNNTHTSLGDIHKHHASDSRSCLKAWPRFAGFAPKHDQVKSESSGASEMCIRHWGGRRRHMWTPAGLAVIVIIATLLFSGARAQCLPPVRYRTRCKLLLYIYIYTVLYQSFKITPRTFCSLMTMVPVTAVYLRCILKRLALASVSLLLSLSPSNSAMVFLLEWSFCNLFKG